MIRRSLVAMSLFGHVLPALPPSDAQCGGYAYTRAFILYRDGQSMRADVYIGGLNGVSPCSFWIRTEVRSPAGRVARAEQGENGVFLPGQVNATARLDVGTDVGSYTGSVQWRVEDDTVYPFQYYTPAPRSDWKPACSANGDQREDLILEYPAFNVTPTPGCGDFRQDSAARYFTFWELTRGRYTWAILHQALFSGLDSTRLNYGNPLALTSGYRSPYHNFTEGGAPGSRHMFNDAADIAVSGGSLEIWRQVCQAALAAGASVEPRALSSTNHVHAQWHFQSGWQNCN